MKTGVRVADAMSRTPVTVSAQTTILECARIMAKKNVGSLLIVKDGAVEGILTEKDLVRFVANGDNAEQIRVHEAMSKKLQTIEPDEDLYDALLKMKLEKIRRLPVVHKNHLVGMLTQNDVLKLQPALFDILQERSHIRTSKGKGAPIKGVCENCENHAELLDVEGRYLCADCKEQIADEEED